MRLNQTTVNQNRDNKLTPNYDRKNLKTPIIHIGVGGFHRSHQAYYLHQLLQQDITKDWAICGVGLREADRGMADILEAQDCLYTLITQHPNGQINSEVIGSINQYLLATDNPQRVIEKMAHEDTKIVSLTITEGGYNFNPATGDFLFDTPDIQHDLQHLNAPKTVYGYLTAALRIRHQKDMPAFTILSCDNIQHNGDMARKMVLAFAKKQDPKLASWIEQEVTFPNAMVDRITPVTTAENIDYLKQTHDIEDKWPVICEPFIQWVIEDNFCNGRPPLEALGVQFVDDVTPYEKMKIRLLNAGHSVLGIPGAIHGHPTIDSCMKDTVFSQFMRAFMDKEVTPILGEIQGMDMKLYKDTLEERFANPNIKDSVGRICSESSAKLPKFLMPTILENLETKGSIKYGAFILAAWCYYSDKGVNEKGEPLEILDVEKDQLHKAASTTSTNWTAFLQLQEVFGELATNPRFIAEYTDAVKSIYEAEDIRSLMQKMLD